MTLEELREKLAAPDTDKPPVVKPKPRFQADDYSEDRMRQEILNHLDFHHCPFPDWQWMRVSEIAAEVWGYEHTGKPGGASLPRIGRVMEKLRKEGLGIQRRLLDGRTRWFVPAPKWRKYTHANETLRQGR
ncbi:MAG: hypothetical protein R3E46_04285 [Sedimenticolaceae bacterium]